MSIFGTFLTVFVVAMYLYVFGRGLPAPRRKDGRIPPLYLACLVLAPMVLFLAGRAYHHRDFGFGAWLAGFSMYLTCVVFLLGTSTLTVDLLTGFGYLMRWDGRARRFLTLALGGVLCVTALVQGYKAPVITEYEVRIADLPKELDGKTVAVLSDLHLGSVLDSTWMDGRVAQVERLQPDMIFLPGDIIEGHGTPDPAILTSLRKLKAPMGVYAVPGNHESFRRRDMPRFEDAGFTVLKDSWTLAAPGLVIAGLDYVRGDPPERIPKALAGRPKGALILIAHLPSHAKEIAAAGAGLMVAGHTHGGQIWPFNYIVGRRFSLIGGSYVVDGMPVIVSRGAGVWGARMRLWKPGEILKVTLRRRDV